MLGTLGLEPDEERVYRALISRPDATTPQLADELGLPAADADAALARLAERGMVARRGDSFTAAAPTLALGALISQRRETLRMAEQAMTSLVEQYRAAAAGQATGGLMEVVTGVNAIRHRYLQVQQRARVQVRSFNTVPYTAVPPGENLEETSAAARGVRVRGLLERAVLAQPGAIALAENSLRNGVHLRVVEQLPMKLALADAELGLVPLAAPNGEPGAVLLHRSTLLDALDALFETMWRQGNPLELSQLTGLRELAAEGPTDLDRTIMTLLLNGQSDQAVAIQVGLSQRTLHRRLHHLMDIAGVRTRMQLGWYAARNGWVESL